MAKFSIIVPVYNVEDYLRNCMDSILNQSYEDYEVIVVNDGTKDNSQDIIDEYVKKDNRVKGYKKKNEGIATTRNYGIKKASGDYIIFVDSDDDIDKDLLLEVNKVIESDEPDIVRFNAVNIGKKEVRVDIKEFSNISGSEAFRELMTDGYFVALWAYAFRRDYWLKNDYTFIDGKVHEDYGLTPYVILKANKVSCINKYLYNYYVREKSIMNDKQLEKERKKNQDVLDLFDINMDRISKDNSISYEDKAYFRSYMANGLITKWKSQKGKLFNDFYKEIKKRGLYMYLLDDTLFRKIKRLVYRISPRYYIRYF